MIYVFDLFGVVVDWNSKYVMAQFAKFAKTSEAKFKSASFDAFNRCESGKMSMDSFWKVIGHEFNCSPSGLEKILEKRFKQKAKLNDGVVKVIEDLRKSGNTVVLMSNQLPVHGEWCKRNGWFDYFDRVFLSYEIGARKPSAVAYGSVASALNVKLSELCLVDDKSENVSSAVNVGMKGVVYVSPEQLRKDLQKIYRLKGVGKKYGAA